MEPDLSDRGQEQAGVWAEVAAEAEWAEIVRGQVPAEGVSAQAVGRKQLIRWEFPAIL